MKELKKPVYSGTTVFEESLEIKRDKSLKNRLRRIKPIIDLDESAFEEKATNLEFHEINETDGVGDGIVSTEEMENLYETVFARKNCRIRKKYYDKMMLVPINGECPLCGHRDVSTMDHYLPKSKNPSLSVTPINLIPTCHECNHTKSKHHPKEPRERFFNPYYDTLPNSTWLIAEVKKSSPPALKFKLSFTENNDGEKVEWLDWHFNKLELETLYSTQAGRTLSGIAEKLKSAGQRGGKEEVRFILKEDAESWGKINQNSWQAAMYQALAKSDWFCEEGYLYAGDRSQGE